MVLDNAWNRTTQMFGHMGVRPVHITAFVLSIMNFTLNAFICIAFHWNKRLFRRYHLYIFYMFAVTNCFSGFFSIVTFINLFIHNNLNCPRWTIMIGSTFEIGLDRVRKILSNVIALERIYAVYFPSYYHLMNHLVFAIRLCAFVLVWGTADSLAMVLEDGFTVIRMHCVATASSGRYFHAYFLITSMIMGVTLLIAYSLFVIKLTIVTQKVRHHRTSKRLQAVREINRQANSLAIAVVLSAILFSVLPSSLYLYDLLRNEIVFMEIGPVITIGYHLYGCSSFFLYSWQHKEIRSAMKKSAYRMMHHKADRVLTNEPTDTMSKLAIPNITQSAVVKTEIRPIRNIDNSDTNQIDSDDQYRRTNSTPAFPNEYKLLITRPQFE